jgi:hypothetical protein
MAVAYGSAQRKADKNEEQNFDRLLTGSLIFQRNSENENRRTVKFLSHTQDLNTNLFKPFV